MAALTGNGQVTKISGLNEFIGMGLSSQITAGENRGRTAQHEYVLVAYQMSVSATGGWKLELPRRHYAGAKDFSLPVWVSHGQDPISLQAVGGMLTKPIAGRLIHQRW